MNQCISKGNFEFGIPTEIALCASLCMCNIRPEPSAQKDIAKNGDETHPSVKICLIQITC